MKHFYEYVHNTHDGRCFVTLTSQGDTSEHSASTRVLHLTDKTDKLKSQRNCKLEKVCLIVTDILLTIASFDQLTFYT